MTKILEIMTVPSVRHRLAHQVSVIGVIVGITLAFTSLALAILS